VKAIGTGLAAAPTLLVAPHAQDHSIPSIDSQVVFLYYSDLDEAEPRISRKTTDKGG
jgi:hypothetical protein